MHFSLDEASLIVDPKGLPFSELQLPNDEENGKGWESLSHNDLFSRLKGRLISNWALYEAQDIITLDYSIGQLFNMAS